MINRRLRTDGAVGLIVATYCGVVGAADRTASDFGGIGLMQTPTARFGADGEFRAGISSVSPYNQLLLGVQLLPWLETGLRYTEVTNRLYGPVEFSGDQTYKDRAVDLKLRLIEEGRAWPALALGATDIGGTGLFSSEYLVATRRYYDFDFTLGLGWGRLGSRGGIRNPLAGLLGGDEKRTEVDSHDIGGVGTDRIFRGDQIALFGGLQWQTPLQGLSLKLEYEGNDYRSEAMDNDQDVDSPVNAAFNYRAWNSVDFSAGLERGNTVMFRVVAYTNFISQRGPAKVLDAPATPAYAVEAARRNEPLQVSEAVDQAFFEGLRKELARQRIFVQAISADPARGKITVWFTQSMTRDQYRAVGRIAQSLAVLAPPEYQAFTLVNLVLDVESYRLTLFRRTIADAVDRVGTIEELKALALLEPPVRPSFSDATFTHQPDYPSFDWGMGPALRQHVGGPDDFYFAQLWWRTNASVTLSRRWSVSGTIGVDVYNNFDGLKNRDTSVLPHVRSDIVRYLKQGENNLVKLETNYAWSPRKAWYARVSAGIFEEMYGGVAAEVLHRKAYAPWALGVNLNWVRQREYDQRFSFRDYRVVTGHLTGYFDLPIYDLHMQLSAGRYLAGDVGGTLLLAREFASGVAVGAFVTKTDVSSEEFGEGSFDKGFFLQMPLDIFFPRSTRRSATFAFRPLTRDGGQKVRDGLGLYGLTDSGHFDPEGDWGDVLR